MRCKAETDEDLHGLSETLIFLNTLPNQVGNVILEYHIDHCVEKVVKHDKVEETIRDLKEALDRFV